MGKGFNIADTFGEVLKNVPNSGTAQITPIDIDLLYADPKNFYRIDPDDVSRLADSISDVGVRQPLDVRPHPDLPGSYMVISGHRRRQAILQLVADGREDLRMVPCVVDTTEGTPEVWEYKLILGNAETRKLSDAELAEQAAHLTDVLYALKQQGYSFSGRMRDIVAEACQVSKSKLARLKVIQERLYDPIRRGWEAGILSEASAYLLAQQDPKIQETVHRKYSSTAWDMTTEDLQKVIDRCKSDALDKSIDKLDEIIREKKQPERSLVDAGKDYVEQLKKEDERFFSQLHKVASGFINGLVRNLPTTRRDSIDRLRIANRTHGFAGGGVDGHGSNKGLTLDDLGKHPITRSWTDVWDMLALIALHDYTQNRDAKAQNLRERDNLNDLREKLESAPMVRWNPGQVKPPVNVKVLTSNLTNQGIVYRAAVWTGEHWVDPANRKKELTGLQVGSWMRIPEVSQLFVEDSTPAAVPAAAASLSGWCPADTPPTHPCDCVVEFDLGDGHLDKILCRWDGDTYRWRNDSHRVAMQPIRWTEVPADDVAGTPSPVLAELVSTSSGWIRVEEGLPTPEKYVLTVDDDDLIEVDCINRSDGEWENGYGDITHWMPLPEPPAKEGGE